LNFVEEIYRELSDSVLVNKIKI